MFRYLFTLIILITSACAFGQAPYMVVPPARTGVAYGPLTDANGRAFLTDEHLPKLDTAYRYQIVSTVFDPVTGQLYLYFRDSATFAYENLYLKMSDTSELIPTRHYVDGKLVLIRAETKGVATPGTNPGTPSDYEKWDIAQSGTYTYFQDANSDPIVVTADDSLGGKINLVYAPNLGHWIKMITPVTFAGNYAIRSDIRDSLNTIFPYQTVNTQIFEGLPKANAVFTFTGSTFSGWKFALGIRSGVNYIVWRLRARDTAITQIAVSIRDSFQSGTILYADTLNVYVPAHEEADIMWRFSDDTLSNNNRPLYFSYGCNHFTDAFCTTTDATRFPQPAYAAVAYYTGGNMSLAPSNTIGSTNRDFWFVMGYANTSIQPTEDISTKIVNNSAAGELIDGVSKVFDVGFIDTAIWHPIKYANRMDIGSTFTGGASYQGQNPYDINSATIIVRNRSGNSNMTQIKFFIADSTKTGTLIASKVVLVNIPAGVTDTVTCTFDSPIPAGTHIYFGYACNTTMDAFGTNTTITAQYPYPEYPVSAYYAIAGDVINLQLTSFNNTANPTTNQRSHWVRFSYRYPGAVPNYALESHLAERFDKTLEDYVEAKIYLPDYLYASVGTETSIYFDGAITTNLPLEVFDIDVTCSKGKHFDRFWRLTPAPDDTGAYSLVISVSFNGRIIATDTTTLVVRAANKGSGDTLKVLVIGDSNWSEGEMADTLRNINPPVFVPIGTRGIAPNKTEAVAGASTTFFTSAGRTYYRFIVTGISTPPGLYSVYNQSGNQFTITEINVTGSTGYFSGYRSAGSGTPTSSGTLTKVSGAGDASITYSSTTTIPGNFLWNASTERVDFDYYFSENSIDSSGDIACLIDLGTNDLFEVGGMSNYQLFVTKNNFDTLIAAWRRHTETKPLFIVAPFPPCKSQDAFGYNYGNKENQRTVERDYYKLVEMLMETYDTEEMRSNGIYFIPKHAFIDRKYNYQTLTRPVNAYNSITETVQSNAVHVAPSGYGEGAHNIASFIKGILY